MKSFIVTWSLENGITCARIRWENQALLSGVSHMRLGIWSSACPRSLLLACLPPHLFRSRAWFCNVKILRTREEVSLYPVKVNTQPRELLMFIEESWPPVWLLFGQFDPNLPGCQLVGEVLAYRQVELKGEGVPERRISFCCLWNMHLHLHLAWYEDSNVGMKMAK